MKIAIHQDKGSWSFSNDWIRYCEEKGYDYKVVNAFDTDIVEQVKDCEIFMWHHNHMIHRDRLVAKQILYSLQQAGKTVFPDFNTGWHFDDKLGQKYMLEAIGAPLVPSYAFFDWQKAREWIESTTFPKVFKLRGGSGSSNVMLVRSKREALQLTKKAILKGIPVYNKKGYLKEAIRRYQTNQGSIKEIMKALAHFIIKTPLQRSVGNEIGYAYFQDFIPDNNFDIRVIVIDNKAFAIKRYCRDKDFRASGSGKISFAKNEIDIKCVELSFKTASDLELQCVGFDWVFDVDGNPLIVEMGYGFVPNAYRECEGYWTKNMEWHGGAGFDFLGWTIEALIEKASEK